MSYRTQIIFADGKKIYINGDRANIIVDATYNDDILYAITGTFNLATTSQTSKKTILKLYFDHKIDIKKDIILKILNSDIGTYIDKYDIGDLFYKLDYKSSEYIVINKIRGKNLESCQISPHHFLKFYENVFNLPILKLHAECDLKTYCEYLIKYQNDKYFKILFYYRVIGNIFDIIPIKKTYFGALSYDDFNDKTIIDKINFDVPIIYFNKDNIQENINYKNPYLFTTKDSNATIGLKIKKIDNFIIPKIKNYDPNNYTYGNYLYVSKELEKIKAKLSN